MLVLEIALGIILAPVVLLAGLALCGIVCSALFEGW